MLFYENDTLRVEEFSVRLSGMTSGPKKTGGMVPSRELTHWFESATPSVYGEKGTVVMNMARFLFCLFFCSTSFLVGCDEQPIEIPPFKGGVGPTGATGPTGPQGPAGPACPVTSSVANDAGVRFCFGDGIPGCNPGSSFCVDVPRGQDGQPGSPGEPGQPGTPGMDGASCLPTSVQTRSSTVPDMEKFCVNFTCSAAPTQRQLCVDRPIGGSNSCQNPGTIVEVRTSTNGSGITNLCVALSCNGQRVSEFSCGPLAPPPGCVPGTLACDCGGGGFCREDLICRGTFCDFCQWGTENCPCRDNDTCNRDLQCQDQGGQVNICEPLPQQDAGVIDAGENDAGSGPPTGTEGGPCYGNGTCNMGLSCLPIGMSSICVRLPDGGVVIPGDAGPAPDATVFPDAAPNPDAAPPTDGGPAVGTEGGDCYGNLTCNTGLTCIPVAGRPNMCVRLPDGGVVVNPDAGVVNPDAAPSNPDAAPSNPDAAPVNPDATPVFPDATPVFPDATPVFPDAGPTFPDAAPVFPDAAPVFPDAAPSNPDAAPSNPDAAASVPDAGAGDGGTPDGGTTPGGPGIIVVTSTGSATTTVRAFYRIPAAEAGSISAEVTYLRMIVECRTNAGTGATIMQWGPQGVQVNRPAGGWGSVGNIVIEATLRNLQPNVRCAVNVFGYNAGNTDIWYALADNGTPPNHLLQQTGYLEAEVPTTLHSTMTTRITYERNNRPSGFNAYLQL